MADPDQENACYAETLIRLREDIRQAEADESGFKVALADVQRHLTEMRRAEAALAWLVGESSAVSVAVSGRPARHADVAERVLRGAGRPLRMPEIAALMSSAGHPLPDDIRNRDAALHSALQRRPEIFRKVSRGLWALVEWDHLVVVPMDRAEEVG